MISDFIHLCGELNIKIAIEKIVWADTIIVFLGILLDGSNLMLSIPIEKRDKALRLLCEIEDKKKATIKQLQVLTGYLNFLIKAIFASRTFIRCMYTKASQYQQGKKLKHHHHVHLDAEFRFDCQVWRFFLENLRESSICRPMIDLDTKEKTSVQLNFSSDASASNILGFGAIFDDEWIYGQWEAGYIKRFNPSIEYLELFVLVVAILTWGYKLKDMRMIVYCDNQAMVQMVNTLTSSCKNCMYLLRLLVLNNLVFNQSVS